MNSLENTANGQTPETGSTLSISKAAAAKFADKWKDTVEEQQNEEDFWKKFFVDLPGIKVLQKSVLKLKTDILFQSNTTTKHKSMNK